MTEHQRLPGCGSYGCGGDGTINEMVNGCFGYGGVEIGAIPDGVPAMIT